MKKVAYNYKNLLVISTIPVTLQSSTEYKYEKDIKIMVCDDITKLTFY
jgi:hypothetical protein